MGSSLRIDGLSAAGPPGAPGTPGMNAPGSRGATGAAGAAGGGAAGGAVAGGSAHAGAATSDSALAKAAMEQRDVREGAALVLGMGAPGCPWAPGRRERRFPTGVSVGRGALRRRSRDV